MRFIRQRVMVINPMYINERDLKVLIKNTKIPIIFDQSIKTGFIVKLTNI